MSLCGRSTEAVGPVVCLFTSHILTFLTCCLYICSQSRSQDEYSLGIMVDSQMLCGSLAREQIVEDMNFDTIVPLSDKSGCGFLLMEECFLRSYQSMLGFRPLFTPHVGQ